MEKINEEKKMDRPSALLEEVGRKGRKGDAAAPRRAICILGSMGKRG